MYKGQKTKSSIEELKKERVSKMTKALEMKKVNLGAMGNVTGGTVNQTQELWKAILSKQGTVGAIGDAVTFIANKVPGAGELSNCVIAHGCEKILDLQFGMKANLSVGWLGTGFRESGNSYSIGNKSYSHAQVLDMINAL